MDRIIKNSGILKKILVFVFAVVLNYLTSAQIVRHPGPDMQSDLDKATLVIIPCSPGAFFMNDKYMTELGRDDTVYFFNLKPGTYNIKLQADTLSYNQVVFLESKDVRNIDPCSDSLQELMLSGTQANELKKPTYKNYNTLKKRSFYNATQLSLLNINMMSGKAHFFQTFTTVFGYQLVPAFCTGIGINYSFCPFNELGLGYNLQSDDVTLHFLPLYFDLRTHLPPSRSGKLYPYFKFDIGYNFLLNPGNYFFSNTGETLYTIKKGGIYISPGFGLRVFISDLFQVTMSVEYSFERSIINVYSLYNPYYYSEHPQQNRMNFFKICLGIAFQK